MVQMVQKSIPRYSSLTMQWTDTKVKKLEQKLEKSVISLSSKR